MSTGLPTLAAAGRKDRSSSRVSSLSDGKLEAVGLARVGRQDAGPAGIGQDRHAAAGRDRLIREECGDVEQLLEALRANDAGLTEERVDHGSLVASAPVCEQAARARRPIVPP